MIDQIIPGSKFRKCCDHEGYILSFYVYQPINGIVDHKEYDLYLFDNNRVCLRYGNNPEEYLSIGTLVDMIKRSHTDFVYQEAVTSLLSVGKIQFTPNK